MNSSIGADYFIDCGGLKLLFPVLMEKALREGSPDELHATQAQCVSILLSLVLHSRPDFRERVLAKLEENEHEKMKKLMAIFLAVAEATLKVDVHRKAILNELDLDDGREEEQAIMNLKLEKGYLTQLSIAFLFFAMPALHPDLGEYSRRLCASMEVDVQTLRSLSEELLAQTADPTTQTIITKYLHSSPYLSFSPSHFPVSSAFPRN